MVCKYSEPTWIIQMKYIGGRTLNPFDVFDDDDEEKEKEEEKEEETEEEEKYKSVVEGAV